MRPRFMGWSMKSSNRARKSQRWLTRPTLPPRISMARPTQLTLCSFCGKSHAEVKKLIQGPGVYICDSCIVVCKSVLDKELRADNKKNVLKLKVPKPAEIKRQLDQYCIGQEQAKKTLADAVLIELALDLGRFGNLK